MEKHCFMCGSEDKALHKAKDPYHMHAHPLFVCDDCERQHEEMDVEGEPDAGN